MTPLKMRLLESLGLGVVGGLAGTQVRHINHDPPKPMRYVRDGYVHTSPPHPDEVREWRMKLLRGALIGAGTGMAAAPLLSAGAAAVVKSRDLTHAVQVAKTLGRHAPQGVKERLTREALQDVEAAAQLRRSSPFHLSRAHNIPTPREVKELQHQMYGPKGVQEIMPMPHPEMEGAGRLLARYGPVSSWRWTHVPEVDGKLPYLTAESWERALRRRR
jgi:hypothetical protein